MASYALYQMHVYGHGNPDIDCEYCFPAVADPYEYYEQIDLKGRRTRQNVVMPEDIRKAKQDDGRNN